MEGDIVYSINQLQAINIAYNLRSNSLPTFLEIDKVNEYPKLLKEFISFAERVKNESKGVV